MKMRQGFVSNSSSSSFVCFTNKETSDAALERMDSGSAELVQGVLFEENFANSPVVGYSQQDCQGEYYYSCGVCGWQEDLAEALAQWQEWVTKIGGDNAILSHCADM